MSQDEQIGFHKGALSTLSKEREELSRMVNVVEQLMQMHVKSLKELGVDLNKQGQGAQPGSDVKPEKKIEDILK